MTVPCNTLDSTTGVCSDVSDSVQPHGLWPARLLCPWDSPGKNTGVGCPPPGNLLTQELNLSPSLAGKFFTTEASGKQTVQDGSKYFPDSL